MPELPTQLKQLKEVYFYRLILIIVPGGEGNTSWLMQWAKDISENGLGRVTWMALDTSHQEPQKFWSDLVAAIQISGCQCSQALVREQEPDEPFCLDLCIEDLINNLAEEIEDVFLIFENYHLIENLEIHSAMQLLIDYLPERAHVILLTQKKLPLQVSRFRVRRQMIEIQINEK